MFATILRRLAITLILLGTGCTPYPRDTTDSSEDAARFGMAVGVSADPPYVVVAPDGSVSGSDTEIVVRFAKAHDFRVRWVVGGHEPLMEQLENARLQLVIGGHADGSPWESRVGWSKAAPVRPTSQAPLAMRRFAVPPGENAWHVLLDRYLVAHESAR